MIRVAIPGGREEWVPDKLQKIALKYLLEHACGGLLLDPGAGKTSIVLAAFKLLKDRGMAERMLVIAPKRVAQLTWPEETARWDFCEGLTIEFIHGLKKEERIWASTADVIVTNFDSLPWLFNIVKTKHSRGFRIDVDKKRAKKLGFDTLVLDELSKFKHSTSGRFKTIKKVTGLFARRWGLTGSVAANGLMGLFGQCLVLDEGRTFGPYITHYRKDYFDKEDYSYDWTLKPGADDRIYKRMAPLMLRLDETDQNVKIPKAVVRVRRIQLPAKARRVYDELESDLITRVSGKTVTAANSAVASMKLRQVCSGAVYTEPDIDEILSRHKVPAAKKAKREWALVHDEKLDALEELTEELEGQPMLIAYDFKHSLLRLKERFGDNIAFIGGGTSDKDAAKYKLQWIEGKLQFLFAHPASVAYGLNLQFWGDTFPRHVCWFDPTWDYEHYDQFIRRIRRRGNKMKSVFVHHIVAEDTLEERMLSVLGGKRRTQNDLYAALKLLTKERLAA